MMWCEIIFLLLLLIEEREGRKRRKEGRKEGREGREGREEKEEKEGTGREAGWRRKGELMGIKMKENILTTVHHTHTV